MKIIFLTCFFLLSSLSSASTETFNVSGKSEFIATGRPAFIKIDGTGTGLTGSLKVTDDLVSGQASFPLSTLDTGISMRDRHMKEEYLEVQKYPDAQLTVNQVKMSKDPSVNGFSQTDVPFEGTLTVHGVSHAVNGTIDVSTSGGIMKGDAKFGIKISDFGFAKPEFMGMTVNNDVKVEVHLQAAKTNAG